MVVDRESLQMTDEGINLLPSFTYANGIMNQLCYYVAIVMRSVAKYQSEALTAYT